MNVNCFFDSNILINAHTDLDLAIQAKAAHLTQNTTHAYISTQVVQEFLNACLTKFKLDMPTVKQLASETAQNFLIYANTFSTIEKSLQLKEKYQFSFWDSMIIAAALELSCNKLYSEDLQHGQVIEGNLTIVNPFI